MTDREKEQLDVDRLLAEIVDADSDGSAHESLEQLLLNNPELQDHYARSLEVHMLLVHELGHEHYVPTMPLGSVRRDRPIEQPTDLTCATLVRKIDRELTGDNRSVGRYALALGLAIATCVAVVFYANWPSGPDQARLAERSGGDADHVAFIDGNGEFVIRNKEVLGTVSRLTRTTNLVSLRLPSQQLNGVKPQKPCTGVALMERSPYGPDRGYLLALEPGWRMEVTIDAEAGGHNVLSMVEFDGQGNLAGSWQSVHNVVDDEKGTARQRDGFVGSISESNGSKQTKYFLLAGAHRLLGNERDESWHQSDCKLQLETQRLMVIGWDDSGRRGLLEDETGDYVPDYDYNDMTAIVRFIPPHVAETPHTIVYVPDPGETQRLADEVGVGCVLDVRPGQSMVLAASSEAFWQNSVRVVEAETRRIVWQHEGTPPKQGSVQPAERGVFAIENNSDVVVRYELLGQFRKNANAGEEAWLYSVFRILDEGTGYMTVGFEDSPDVPGRLDWQDIRVMVHWFDN